MINRDKNFAPTLLQWNREKNTRQMPWKGEKNPYYIWLSEIILQQTRVEQGLPYFLRFKAKYPSVKHLAEAAGDEVMRLWQGLGYYSRARNLHETAKQVQNRLKGKFPNSFEGLRELKGVGDYTAAAIASFAFGEKRAVVDGNVIRVLSRVFGIETAFDTSAGKKQFAELAQQLISSDKPGEYNQAIMDFGAVVCSPKNPNCQACPFRKMCVALKENKIEQLPFREKKTRIKSRYFNYLLIKSDKEVFIEKRTGKDIWQNLYQLPLIETEKPITRNFHPAIERYLGVKKFTINGYSKPVSQMLSHRKVHFRFIEVELEKFGNIGPKNIQKAKLKDLHKFAFPKTIVLYLSENSLL